MSTTTTPTAFSDLITACQNQLREGTGTAVSTILKSLLNQANHDVHLQQNWPWSERRDMIRTASQYAVGGVSVAAATRTTIEGAGTTWNTAVTGMGVNNVRAGGKVVFGGEQDVYSIASVASDTSATLDTRYIGGLATSTAYALAYGTYTYFEDEYALASDFWRLVDARQFSDAITLPVIARQEFYRRYPRNASPGTPRVCTIIDLGPAEDTDQRQRVVLHPAPSAPINIPYRYITSSLAVNSAGTGQANMSADTDEPIIPPRYRHILVFYVLTHWYRGRKDDARSAEAAGHYADLMRRMAGDVSPERDHPRLLGNRRQYLVNTSGAYRRLGGRRRYTTGTGWDSLRE